MKLKVLAFLLASFAAAPLAAQQIDELIAELGLQEGPRPVRELSGWRPGARVVIADVEPGRIDWLRATVPDMEFVAVKNATEAAREAANADVVIGYCSEAVVGAGKRLRWIQVLSAGVENCVSLPGLRERKILLTNMQKVAGPVMSEHVLALTLGLARGLASYVPQQATGDWRPQSVSSSRMWALEGRRMLVVGLGGIGVEVARRAEALGMTVTAIRASGRHGPAFVSAVGLPEELHAYASAADVVVNTLPLTEATQGLFDAKFFDAIKRGALFINVGRGASVVTADLIAALQDGRLGGAGLDVTDPEPLPPDHALWRAPNVLITPHVSARMELSTEPRWLIVRENLRRYAAGEALLSVVDLERGY